MKLSDTEIESRQRLRKHAMLLIEEIDKQTPELLIALTVVNLFRTAWVVCGEHLATEFGRMMISSARVAHGLCQTCDNSIFPPQHAKHCEQCDAKFDTELEKLEKESE